MKKVLLSAALMFISATLFAQNFKVSGELAGWEATKVQILLWDGEGTNYKEVTLDGQKFSYEGTCSMPFVARINHNDKKSYKNSGGGYIPTKSMHLWAVVFPGADITLNGKMTDYPQAYAGSDAENIALSNIHRQVFPLINESLNLSLKAEQDKSLTSEQAKELATKSKELSTKAMAMQKQLIRENPSSIASIWYLDDMLVRSQITPEEVETILTTVDKKYENHPYYKTLVDKIAGSKSCVVGSIAPNIVSSLTPDGKEFNLQSLRGKYVVIDFWGTWCGPCMSGMPKLREYKEKYADKLEVVGIAKDSKMEPWKAAIVKHNLAWHQIFNGKDDQNFVAKYNVAGFPTKLILNPRGVIVYRTTGESEEFYTKLDELLGK